MDPHPAGLWQTFLQRRRELALLDRPEPERDEPAQSSSPAARCSAGPAPSTAWSISAAIARTTTSGASSATPAGAMKMCCPISARPRTSNAAKTSITVSAARLRCPTLEETPAGRSLSSMPPRPPVTPATTTSTGRPDRLWLQPVDHAKWATLLDRCWLSETRPQATQSDRSPPKPMPSACCLTATRPAASNTMQKGQTVDGPCRTRNHSSRAVRSTPRNCCSFPGWGRPNCCASRDRRDLRHARRGRPISRIISMRR